VRDDDDGVTLLVECLKNAMISSPVRLVQVAGRFVGQQNRRVGNQGPGDGHPLPLPAGELIGFVVHAVGQPRPASGRRRPLSLAPPQPGI